MLASSSIISSTQPSGVPVVNALGNQLIPTVAAGRHPQFYFEDGTIVLKVGYLRLSSSISVTDFATLADSSCLLQGSPTFSY